MKYGYARVSSTDQNLARQLDAFKKEKIASKNIYCDKKSGKDTDRENLSLLLETVKKNDCIVISSLDRLSRNYDDIKALWSDLTARGVSISVLDNPLISTNNKTDTLSKALTDIMLSLLAFVADNERAKIRERQRQGIELARKEKKYKGKPVSIDLPTFMTYYKRVNNGLSVLALCREIGITPKTYYNLKKRYITD